MTGWNNTPAYLGLNVEVDQHMLALWQQGNNTLDIARIMCVPESEVANRLPHILERARQDAEWSAA